MLVSLITKTGYHTLQLPEWMDGHFSVVHPDSGEELFSVIGNGSFWQLFACGDSQLQDDIRTLKDGQLIRARVGKNMENVMLFTEKSGPHYAMYGRCVVGDRASFVIGTGEGVDIPLQSNFIAPRHCILSCENRKWSVQALDARLSVYVNGKRVSKAQLQPGDTVSLMNQKFIVLPGVLAMNAQNLNKNAPRGKLIPLSLPPVDPSKLISKSASPSFFHREPRFTRSVQEKNVYMDAPSSPISSSPKTFAGAQQEESTVMTFGPAIASNIAMIAGGMMNPIVGIGMIIGSIAVPMWKKQKQQETAALQQQAYQKQLEDEARQEQARQKHYLQYLQQIDHELDTINKKQAEQLLKLNPRADHEAEALLRDKASLWNRRPQHADFLDIRLGTADLPATANINFSDDAPLSKSDPLWESIRAVREKRRTLKGVPIMLPLDKFRCVGVAGSPDLTSSLIGKMMLQLSMHIGYDDLKICILGKLPEQLEALRWLPHTWNDGNTVHMVAQNKDELTLLLPDLDNELQRYHAKSKYNDEAPHKRSMVFLIMDEELANSSMVASLLFDHPCERVHVICVASHSRHLPRNIDMAVGLLPGQGCMVWHENQQRLSQNFAVDPSVTSFIQPMAELMANTRLDIRQEMSKMPDVVPFLDLFGVKDISRLNIMSRWQRSDPIRTLTTPIGISEDGNLCMLDLHEKGEGPHGLVAGTTGSGKSEMLINYILSMAVNYSPEEVSFVLIDYKGGGMAKVFEHLPHTAGIITNLDGNEIKRSLQSIESELERRLRIFADCQKELGAQKVDIYLYQKLYREKKLRHQLIDGKKVWEPLSHLIIIADEFAELKDQQSEFLSQLVRAARIGRSLGVHLILATQKPMGVVDDQISSNTNFHICLRVQTPNDSREVLKCEDAAYLTRVGSMLKQVGYGEVLVKAQSGWGGADYAPDRVSIPGCGVDVLNSMGGVLRHEALSSGQSSGSQMEACIEYIEQLGKTTQLHARQLWEPVLEKTIPLADLRAKYAAQDEPWLLQPVLGEADDPSQQRRSLLRLNFSSMKNTVLYGASGSGKVMALQTIMEDLLLHHTAQEMHIYVLDCADDGLGTYLGAPQVGDVISSTDEEKMQRFLMMLKEQLRIRKKRLDNAVSGKSLPERMKDAGIENILVIIHHIIAFQHAVGYAMDEFKTLMIEGPRRGITFFATQEATTGLQYTVAQCFPQKYTLQLDSSDDYQAVMGRTDGFRPMAAIGRGIYRDERLFEFQTATANHAPQELCEALNQQWKGPRAEPIRILPDQLTSGDLADCLQQTIPWRLPVALNTRSIRPEFYNFAVKSAHIALGRPRLIAQTFNGIAALAVKNGIHVTVLDPDQLMDPIEGADNVWADRLISKLEEMRISRQELFKRMNSGETIPMGDPALFILPDIRTVWDCLDDTAKEDLQTMISKANTRPIWNWRFLVGGTVETMRNHIYNASGALYDAVTLSSGMYMGKGFADNGLLKFDQITAQNIEYPMGYIVRDEEATTVQFVQESERGGADAWSV